MRSMRRGEWPAQTRSDKINRYRGKIAFNNRSLLSVLVNGRLEFEVEFGDAAGETWHELASEADAERAAEQSKQIEDSQLRLIESTFFAYVGESDSLFYFIDMENFVIADPEKVTEAVDDLLSTIQLLRTIEGGGPLAPLEKPIAVILSKADMLSTNKLHEIKKIISDISRPPTGEGAQFDASLRELDRLNTVLQRYSRSYRLFLVSSLAEDRTTREHQYSRTSDRIDWESYSEFRTAIPVEWVFYRLWRLRRSKRRGI